MRRTIAGLLAATLLLGAAACEKVPAPTSDPTPPTLNWHVENRTAATAVDVAGSGSVTGAPGDEFRVTLTANDKQGIHTITMDGGYTLTCRDGDTAQNGYGDY